VVIHSIQTAEDEVVTLIGADGTCSGAENEKKHYNSLPRQIKVSWLPSSSLLLAPNQVAKIPVSFLPRFPNDVRDNRVCSGDGGTAMSDDCEGGARAEGAVTSSSFLHEADMTDWLGLPSAQRRQLLNRRRGEIPRSNRYPDQRELNDVSDAEEYEVKTTVFVETDKGLLTLPVRATSIRNNDYGLPDSISFRTIRTIPAVSSSETETRPNVTKAAHESLLLDENFRVVERKLHCNCTRGDYQVQRSEIDNCFDLYLRHPQSFSVPSKCSSNIRSPTHTNCSLASSSDDGNNNGDQDLHVLQVLVSLPEHVSLSIIPEKNPKAALVATSSRQAIQTWKTKDATPLSIPRDGQPHYVVTVCSSSNINGTYVTDTDEKVGEYLREVVPLIEPTNERTWLGFLQVQTDVDTLFVSLEQAENKSLPQSTTTGVLQSSTLELRPADELEISGDRENAVLHGYPESISVHLISSALPKTHIPIEIYNAESFQPITIMQMSAVFKASEPELEEKVGLKLNVFGKGLDDPIPITYNETLEEGFFFECSVDWDKFTSNLLVNTAEVFGTIILRGTSQDWSYEEWEAAIMADPSVDSDLVIEIPFSVKFTKGKIGWVLQETSHPFSIFWLFQQWCHELETVTGAFFPVSKQELRASLGGELTEDIYALKSMNAVFRVFTDAMDMNVKVGGVLVLDENGIEVSPNGSQESVCNRFKVSLPHQNQEFYAPNLTNCGVVELKYFFSSDKEGVLDGAYTSTCYLRLSTVPDTGDHVLPLIIYSGEIDVSGIQHKSNTLKNSNILIGEEGDQSGWQNAVVGVEKLFAWLQTSKAGRTWFRALSSFTGLKGADQSQEFLHRYLSVLSHGLLNYPRMQPILLQAGAIAKGEVETIPLYMTNYNPVPLEISIVVSDVEGMSISLAREQLWLKKTKLHGYQPGKPHAQWKSNKHVPEPLIYEGLFRGHPVNGLYQFLLTDKFADSFLQSFAYQDAVSRSNRAISELPLLETLFRKYAVTHFHKHSNPQRFSPGSMSTCNNAVPPSQHGSFEKKLSKQRLPGPFIISDDGESARHLAICKDKNSMLKKRQTNNGAVLIPPGGVACFNIHVRSPPSIALHKDITEFLATGLILSTNHGESLPVVIAFEALNGKLEVSQNPSFLSDQDRLIHAPLNLFQYPSATAYESELVIPPGSATLSKLPLDEADTLNATTNGRTVPLFMRSSFTQNVLLHEVHSCNPLFEVILGTQAESSATSANGLRIGAVKNVLPCNLSGALPTNVSGQPAFFHCCLSWLLNRAKLQPRGCGLLPATNRQKVSSDGFQVSASASINYAIQAFKHALIVFEYAYAPFSSEEKASLIQESHTYKSNKRSSDGLVPQAVIDAMAAIWNAWNRVADLSLDVMSTSLHAVIGYNSTVDEIQSSKTRILSLDIPKLIVKSVLKPPKLVDPKKAYPYQLHTGRIQNLNSVLEFPATPLAKVSSLYLPLHNPTSIPVRVRLAVLPPRRTEKNADQHQLQKLLGVDQKLRTSFTGRFIPPYIQPGKSKQRAHKRSSLNNWWDEIGGFYLNDFDGDIIRSHHNVTIIAGANALVSLFNPSLLASTAFILGCGSRCGFKGDENERRMWSPIGASASIGSNLFGRKKSRKPHDGQLGSGLHAVSAGGSLYTAGAGPAAFAIPFSALDEVIIPPFSEAEIGPLYFRPPGHFTTLGCQLRKDSGLGHGCDSDLFESKIFLENSLSGLEHVILRGKAQLERIAFVDPIPLSEEEFGSIELRYGLSALVFPGKGPHLVSKEVVVLNSGDLPVKFSSVFLSKAGRHIKKAQAKKSRQCVIRNFHLVSCESLCDGFSLLPGQNRSIHIEHMADCRQKKEFISLYFEIDHSRLFQAPKVLINNASLLSEGSLHTLRHYDMSNLGSKSPVEAVQLLIGYEMSKKEFSLCNPASNAPLHTVLKNKEWTPVDVRFCLKALVLLLCLLGATAAMKLLWSQASSYGRFHSILNSSKLKINRRLSTTSGKNWFAAFRYLACTDPMLTDLQTLSREQMRQMVLARYRAMGSLQPQCLSNTGALHRDRGVVVPKPSQQITGASKEGRTDRARTLSDATFLSFIPPVTSMSGYLPCEFGWQVAAIRGIIHSFSLKKSSYASKTEALLVIRQLQMGEEVLAAGKSEQGEDVKLIVSSTGIDNDGESTSDHPSDISSCSDELQEQLMDEGIVHASSENMDLTSESEDALSLKAEGLELKKGSVVKEEQHEFTQKNGGHFSANTQKGESIQQKPKIPLIDKPADLIKISAKLQDQAYLLPISVMSQQEPRVKGIREVPDIMKGKKQKKSTSEQMKEVRSVPRKMQKGPSSKNSRKTMPQTSAEKHVAQARLSGASLKCPPGLSPPPGFQNTVDSSSFTQLPATAGLSMPGILNADLLAISPVLASTGTQDNAAISVHADSNLSRTVSGDSVDFSLGGSSLLSGEQPPPPLFHDDVADFDIMDFLDGVLNDTGYSDEDDLDIHTNDEGLHASADDLHVDEDDSVEVPIVSANPWASSPVVTAETRSRLTAYGIVIEDGSERTASENPVDLPLLTPADILQTAVVEVESRRPEEEENHGRSFYATLPREF